jgi:hypothetical protein
MENKKVRLYYMGKRQKDIYLHKTKWEVFVLKIKHFFKVLLWWTIVIAILVGIFEAGGYLKPKKIYTKQEVIKEVEVKAPILDRIIMCESKNSHFDSNGQVLMRSNTNRTVDLGVAQINTVWFKKATELGYDLTKEQDNRAMALWIYKNVGTDPWNSSKSCWK